MRRVAAPELPRAGTQELGPRNTWARVSARLAICLDLELVYGVPGLHGKDKYSTTNTAYR
jgi:hypothetical protein